MGPVGPSKGVGEQAECGYSLSDGHGLGGSMRIGVGQYKLYVAISGPLLWKQGD